MNEVTEYFEERREEVEVYFRFLKQALHEDVHLFFPRKRTWNRRPFDSDTSRILKASGFLVLYNLIECTVRLAIRRLHFTLRENNLSYGDASPEIRSLWVKSFMRDLSKNRASHSTYLTMAQEIANIVANESALEFKEDAIPLAGALDAKRLREIGKSYGLSRFSVSMSADGDYLKTIKDRRNELAHGHESFKKCGGNYSVDDLLAMKKAVIKCMRAFLRNMKRFLENREYSTNIANAH